MRWVARGARAGALSALALGWGLAAHLAASGDHGPSGEPSAGAVLWAAVAVLLLAWSLLAPRPDVGSAGRAARLLVTVGAGQGLTHAALVLSPLLADQARRPAGPAGADARGDHAGHLAAVVVGAPGPSELLTALGHGGSTMLVLHTLASVAVVLLWTAAGAVWREAVAWWGRLVASTTLAAPSTPPWSAAHRELLRVRARAHRSWDGRAPPAPALP